MVALQALSPWQYHSSGCYIGWKIPGLLPFIIAMEKMCKTAFVQQKAELLAYLVALCLDISLTASFNANTTAHTERKERARTQHCLLSISFSYLPLLSFWFIVSLPVPQHSSIYPQSHATSNNHRPNTLPFLDSYVTLNPTLRTSNTEVNTLPNSSPPISNTPWNHSWTFVEQALQCAANLLGSQRVKVQIGNSSWHHLGSSTKKMLRSRGISPRRFFLHCSSTLYLAWGIALGHGFISYKSLGPHTNFVGVHYTGKMLRMITALLVVQHTGQGEFFYLSNQGPDFRPARANLYNMYSGCDSDWYMVVY